MFENELKPKFRTNRMVINQAHATLCVGSVDSNIKLTKKTLVKLDI